MGRLKRHFENAVCCTPNNRQLGIELETLFGARDGKPIDQACSQQMMKTLVEKHDWEVDQTKTGFLSQLSHKGFVLLYELGANNLELNSPPFDIDDFDLFVQMDMLTAMLSEAARSCRARALPGSWDEHTENNLMIPDKRDKIWLVLDGPALFGLGHIASIQFNIDLCSIDEGMEFIVMLNHLYPQMNWPNQANFQIWRDYIKNSWVGYEPDRYGPAPENFRDYLWRLSEMRVVMTMVGNDPVICNPPRPFALTPDADMEMFLRSVWWYTRLRVRNGKLVLEIRDIDRQSGIQTNWLIIREHLGL